jgi:anti-sigma28 factor (negative regulator of flagellin synthesis)
VSREDPDTKPQDERSTIPTNVVAHARSKSRASIQSAGGTRKSKAPLTTEPIDWKCICELIEQLPEIDASKVVRLHNQIIAEEYRINTRKIAKKIMETELTLYR